MSPESATPAVAKSRIVARGVTALEAAEAGPVPTALVAVTLNVYAVPFVEPRRRSRSSRTAPTGTGVCAAAPMYGVTVWPVIGLSPSPLGRVQVTRAWFDAGWALTPVGAVGTTAACGVTGVGRCGGRARRRSRSAPRP